MRGYPAVALGLAVVLGAFAHLMGASAAVDQLSVGQACRGGRVDVTFQWSGTSPIAVEQWLDLSTSDNAWLDGTFLSAGPLPASAASFAWQGLTPGVAHFVRVNERLDDGSWQPSASYTVQTIECPISAASPPPPAARPPRPTALPPNLTINVVDCATASPALAYLVGCPR